MASAITKPLVSICPEKERLKEGGRQYVKRSKGPAKLIIIPDAGHNFNEEGAEEKLFVKTLAWLKSQK